MRAGPGRRPYASTRVIEFAPMPAQSVDQRGDGRAPPARRRGRAPPGWSRTPAARRTGSYRARGRGWLWRARRAARRSRPRRLPSTRTVLAITTAPVRRRGTTSSIIERITAGTPASTNTLPIWNPGGPCTPFFTSLAALGHPRHATAGGVHVAPPPGLHHLEDLGVLLQRHAERLRHAVGGDVVVRGTNPAGGDHIVVAAAQRIQGGDDVFLDVGDDAGLGEVDAVGADDTWR